MSRLPFPTSALSALCLVSAFLSGCASLQAKPSDANAATPAATATAAAPAAASPPAPGASGPATAASPPAAPAAGAPPAFATVIKDAKPAEGLFTVWRKDEKVWFELKPEDFGASFFLSPKLATGLGEGRLYGGLMFGPWMQTPASAQPVQFRRINNQVQLIAVNFDFTAKAGTPEAQAVKAAFSPSLVGSTAVASQPHPERKSILVDASSLFVGDWVGMGGALQRLYRQSYAFDARNSSLTTVRNTPEQLVIEVLGHYATASLAVPAPNAPPGTPAPTVPQSLPDPRSLFLTTHYSLTKLPAQPMRARKADARIGYFQTVVADFSDDLERTPKQRLVNRWRLEKKDPAAEMSEPVKPITFWLDRNIPEKYRPPIAAGILEWNKAFERIGFKDAVVVKQQADDDTIDTLDTQRASVRWMTNSSPSFGAIGPSHVDPRSGEILDADIGFESLSARNLRSQRSQILSAPGVDGDPLNPASVHAYPHAHDPRVCNHAGYAAEQMGYALDVLEARGDVDPDGPEARQFVLDYLKDVTMHEVGHTLGLRHNFRASRLRTEQQLADPAFTRSQSITGSVMEYSPVNLAAPGAPPVGGWEVTLGPYDYWAIEYGYKPLPPESEAAELAKIGARSAEPELAYGTDEDNSLGVDPETIQFDLGNDPLSFARKRFAIARELLGRQEVRNLKTTEDYGVLRRSVTFAIRDVGRAANTLVRHIGGVRTLRDFPGSGRDPLQPVPAAMQREALDIISRNLFTADALQLSPALLRRMAPDFSERLDALSVGDSSVTTDFSLTQTLLDLQRGLLGQLMSDSVAVRLLDSEAKFDRPAEAFRLSELYSRLTRDLWSELSGGADITAQRRELQREHLNRLSTQLLRPTALSRADERSLLRAEARALLARIEAAARRGSLSAESRAHLQDSADTLRLSLEAKLSRSAG